MIRLHVRLVPAAHLVEVAADKAVQAEALRPQPQPPVNRPQPDKRGKLVNRLRLLNRLGKAAAVVSAVVEV